MILEAVSVAAEINPLELIERPSSTPRVREAVELSLAPAFLLVGIGSMMNVMMQRLVWLANRIERLCANSTSENPEFLSRLPFEAEIEWLTKRRRLARTAVKLSTGAALVISVVIALMFVSAFIETRVGAAVAVLWVASVSLLIAGLTYFLREALMAADGPQDTLTP